MWLYYGAGILGSIRFINYRTHSLQCMLHNPCPLPNNPMLPDRIRPKSNAKPCNPNHSLNCIHWDNIISIWYYCQSGRIWCCIFYSFSIASSIVLCFGVWVCAEDCYWGLCVFDWFGYYCNCGVRVCVFFVELIRYIYNSYDNDIPGILPSSIGNIHPKNKQHLIKTKRILSIRTTKLLLRIIKINLKNK